MSSKESYYVVKKGNQPGIYKTWEECKKAVTGFSSPIYRKFTIFEEAYNFYHSKDISKDISKDVQQSDLDEQIQKVKELVKQIKSSDFSNDINYSVEHWNTINNEIYIFTDGSSRRSSEHFNSGVGIYLGYKCTNIKEKYHDKTNNHCELTGIDYAFKLIIRYCNELSKMARPIKIVSDSEYSIKCCSIWVQQWKNNNWKTKSGDDVKNKDIIESIDTSMQRIKLINSKLDTQNKIKVSFLHINSHQKPDITDKFKYSLWFGNYVADGLSQNII
jgi:ribonuclease HI